MGHTTDGHTFGHSEGRHIEGRRAGPTVWTAAFVWPAPAPITSQPEWPGVPVGVVEVHEAIVVVEAIEEVCNSFPVRWLRLAGGVGWCCDRSPADGRTLFTERTQHVAARAAELGASAAHAAHKLVGRTWLPWQLFSQEDVLDWGAAMVDSAHAAAAVDCAQALRLDAVSEFDPADALGFFAKVRQRHPDAYAWRKNLKSPTAREALRSLLELRARARTLAAAPAAVPAAVHAEERRSTTN